MTLFDAFRYDGKRALVVGGATGMGAAVAELAQDAGAEVVVMDRADGRRCRASRPSSSTSPTRRRSTPPSTSAAGPSHALFSCAGVADGTPGIERINFIGHRHLIDRMLAADMLPRGSAIGMISSAAGLGWEAQPRRSCTSTSTSPTSTRRRAWAQRQQQGRLHVEQAGDQRLRRARGVRLPEAGHPHQRDPARARPNTPLAQANAEMWLGFGADYREAAGIEASTPLEQAYPLVFLCSDAASGVTGVTIVTDAGYFASGVTESFPPRRRRSVGSSSRSDLTGRHGGTTCDRSRSSRRSTSGSGRRAPTASCASRAARDCGTLVHPPVPICPACRSRAWEPDGGVGPRRPSSASPSTSTSGCPASSRRTSIAIVALDEDPSVHLTTNIVGCEPDDVHIGQEVAVRFEQHDDVWLPLFEPTGEHRRGRPGRPNPSARRRGRR